MPGAEGNDHVRLLDSEGSSKRTDSVLSPRAVEGAEQLQGDAVAAAGLTLSDTDTVTGVATGTRDNPPLPASGTSGFGDPQRVTQSYSFPVVFPEAPALTASFARVVPGVEVGVATLQADGFALEFVNVSTSDVNTGEAPIIFVAVATE
jgi:hypothetical protein